MSTVPKHLEKSIRVVLQNGHRLLDDATFIEFEQPPTSALYLTEIAKEEIAKAFLLALCLRGIIPWNPHVLRASRDHTCKQLLCIIIDYICPSVDEFINRCNAVVLQNNLIDLPAKVADAINMLRHEKIGRWESRNWFWAEAPNHEKSANAVAEGVVDRLKQDLIYVRLTKDARAVSKPNELKITRGRLVDEIDKAKRFACVVDSLLEKNGFMGLEWSTVEDVFRAVFAGGHTSGHNSSRSKEY